MIIIIKRDLTNGYDTLEIDGGKDVIIKQNNSEIRVIISSSKNQQDYENEKNNITSINFREYESKLKEHYKISKDKYLYILRIDVPQKGIDLVKLEYEVYYPLHGKNLELLNLSYCEEFRADIYVPFEITDDLFKLNFSSDYYNDICYTYTSEKGTDVILKDRQQEYIDNNKFVCEENCIFSRYDTNTRKAICSCEIKVKLPLISEIKFDKKKIYDSFTDIKNIANINIMKCYYVFLSLKGISYNYGCYIIILIFIIHIVCNFVFCFKGFKKIKTTIKNIIFAIKNLPRLNKLTKEDKKKRISTNKNSFRGKQINNKKNTYNPKQELEDIENNKKVKAQAELDIKPPIFGQFLQLIGYIPKNKEKISVEKSGQIKTRKIFIKKKNKIIYHNSYKNDKDSVPNSKSKFRLKRMPTTSKTSWKIDKKYEFIRQILNLNDSELNELCYKEALKNDHRSFGSFYLSLIKLKHLLIFSFFPINDYNSQVVKIDLFFINFAIYFTVNTLFFSDKTMHKIYIDNGDYNILYQFPQILYSSLISGIINGLLKFLSLTGQNIIKLKHAKNNFDLDANKTIQLLKNKLLIFFIMVYISLLAFWYYVGCFCAIYINTQIHLIKDSVMSFGLSFIYPFIIYIFPSIFRITSLKNKKDKRECMYKFSKFLQLF